VNTRKFYNLLKYLTVLFFIFSLNNIYATDYSIGDGTTQTSRVTLTNSDTLTIAEGGTLNYYWPAVDADNRTFSSGTTQVTNGGTITGAGYLVDFRSSTNATLVNNGTMTATSSSRALYINNSDNTTITNTGIIQISASNAYEAIDGDSTTDLTITNSGTISSAGDDAIAIASAEDVTITNSGTISAADDNIIDADGIDGLTLTNSGSMTATDDFGLYMRNASGTLTITNSGTISSAIYPMYYTGDATLNLTNSGTITLTDGLPYDVLSLNANATLTNTGTISGGRYAVSISGASVNVTNKGTINGGTYDFMSSTDGQLVTLTNGQGGNDCVNWYGYLPTNYKIYIASASSYGKMCNDGSTWYMWGDTAFSIDTASTLEARTYTDVFKWTASSDFASGTTGTCSCANGSFNWTLSDSNSDTHWDLVVTSNDTTAPTLSSSTPADNATGVAVNANIVLTFSEAVDAESGNITIKKTSDNSTIETIDVTGAKVSGSGGTQITVNPGTNWDEKTEYYVLIDASAFDDGNSNSYAGISSTTALSFTTVDSTNPTLSSASPADNATSVATNNNIVLTFDEAVDAESGNITIKKTSDNSTIETIDVTGSKVSGSGGTQITINPGTDWAEQTEHYVLIDASAFDDASGNSYAGISSTTALSFTTGDETNPSLSSSKPADNGTDILVSANIILTFSEAVDAESGNITIKKKKDNSTIETIDVTGDLVSGSGSTAITINPSKDLSAGIEYYVLIDASAFDDSAGNSYAGISSTTALNFKTKLGEIFSKTVKTLTKNQSAASVQTMAQSLTRVNSRMNYIRPGSTNTFRQNIRLAMNFDDPFANQLFDSLARKFLKPKKETKGWAVWTEGNVAFGRIANHDGNLGQDIHSDGVTIGVDKKITENKTVGFAINKAWQETEVGSNEANMDAAAISMLTYGSFRLKENTYFETAIGVGEMDIDLDRSVTEGRNKGVRKGNQLFGSFTYLLEPDIEDEENNLNYYTRLDLGFTQLGDYTETGDGTAVSYNKQNVKSTSLSVGFNLRKMIEIQNGILTPHFKFEIGKDKTINSLSEAYYINDSSTIYTNAIADQNSEHALLSLGLGAQLHGDFTINVSYDHYRNTNETFMNSFTINLRKSF